MTKLESLQDIKDTAARLQETLMGADLESIRKAEKAFQQLVDQFYQENEDMMAPQQYRDAKDDPDYFLVLIQLAYHDQDQKNVDSDGGNHYLILTGS
jgi:hypothetical protein